MPLHHHPKQEIVVKQSGAFFNDPRLDQGVSWVLTFLISTSVVYGITVFRDLKVELSGLKSSIGSLSTSVALLEGYKTDIASLKSSASDLDRQVRTETERSQQRTLDISSLKQQIADLDRQSRCMEEMLTQKVGDLKDSMGTKLETMGEKFDVRIRAVEMRLGVSENHAQPK